MSNTDQGSQSKQSSLCMTLYKTTEEVENKEESWAMHKTHRYTLIDLMSTDDNQTQQLFLAFMRGQNIAISLYKYVC